MNQSRDLTRTRELLRSEERSAEKSIALIRVSIFALLTILNLIQALLTEMPLHQEVLPLAGATLFSILMWLELLWVHRKGTDRRFFGSAVKYLYILIDAGLICLLTVVLYQRTLESPAVIGLEVPAEFFLPLLYLFWVIIYLILDLFRFSAASSIFTGITFMAAYAANIWFLDPTLISQDFILYSSIFFGGCALTASVLAAVFSTRFRSVVSRGKRQDQFERFLPETLAKEILDSDDLDSAETREVAILFADIKGFTAMSESLPPGEIVAFLNDYFGRMIDSVFDNGGTLDKIIGDGLMAIFGAPRHSDHFCLDAVETARDMLSHVTHINQTRARDGLAPISIGVGIHAGEVVMGRIGSDRRMDYTAIGDTVITASRLEGLTRKTGADLIFSEAVRDRLPIDYPVQSLGWGQVRGKTMKVKVFSV